MKHRKIELNVTHRNTDLAQRHNSFPYHQVLLILNVHHFSVFSYGLFVNWYKFCRTGLLAIYSPVLFEMINIFSDSPLVYYVVYTHTHTPLGCLKNFHTQSANYHFKTLAKYLAEVKATINSF